MTAVNIPDMVKVIREHGLIPVPVDIDPETLEPSLADIDALVNERTVALLVAQIYGRGLNMAPFGEVSSTLC